MKFSEQRVLYQNLYEEGIALMGSGTLHFPVSGGDAKKICERRTHISVLRSFNIIREFLILLIINQIPIPHNNLAKIG